METEEDSTAPATHHIKGHFVRVALRQLPLSFLRLLVLRASVLECRILPIGDQTVGEMLVRIHTLLVV